MKIHILSAIIYGIVGGKEGMLKSDASLVRKILDACSTPSASQHWKHAQHSGLPLAQHYHPNACILTVLSSKKMHNSNIKTKAFSSNSWEIFNLFSLYPSSTGNIWSHSPQRIKVGCVVQVKQKHQKGIVVD